MLFETVSALKNYQLLSYRKKIAGKATISNSAGYIAVFTYICTAGFIYEHKVLRIVREQ